MDRPDAGRGLGRPELQLSVDFVQRSELWVDLDTRVVVGVGADPLESGQLAHRIPV